MTHTSHEVNVNVVCTNKVKFERSTMMKKLLVLALVLGIAGFASAGLALKYNGADVDPMNPMVIPDGGLIDIQMDYTGVDYYVAIVSNTVFALVGNASVMPDLSGEVLPSIFDSGSALVAGVDAGFDGPIWTIASSTGAVKPMASFFTIAGAQKGIYQVLLVKDDGQGMYSTKMGEVIVTPEPMTMLLLGLGGLFLRRK